MIDTHCHLDIPAFDHDRLEVLERARQAGVVQCLIPGVRLSDFPRMMAHASPELLIAFGLHPIYLEDHPVDGVAQLESWVVRCKPVAIGEIGLDFLEPAQSHEAQRILLEEQLRLAKQYRLPVLLHVRKAHDQVFSLLRRLAFPWGGIAHAFNGSLQQAHRLLDLGFCLGFGGVVTYERARRIRHLATVLPDEALVLETDAPDLSPVGQAGKRNEPCNLLAVAQTLAELRHMELGRIMEITTHNARNVLGLSGRC
ncbi:MAG: TatD family hydrolase [Magnetococcus sp. YQC-5]